MSRLLLVAALALAPYVTWAQGTIQGTVRDEGGQPLPGANVIIRDTMLGAATGADGRYTIANVPAGTHVLVASFVGFAPQQREVTVRSGETVTVDFALRVGIELEGITVDALGFAAAADRLGTSQTSVDGSAIVRSGETNVLRGLAAKAPGLNVTASGGDPGSSTRILIRGQNSIQGNNQPLIVIDGVPVSNSTVGSGVAGVQQQSRLNDLNPEDIESVEVLRSASAAALWGSRAQAGVIVITTRSGRARARPNVSFRSTISVDEVNKVAPLQTAYGAGINGLYQFVPAGGLTWGDRIADRPGGADQVNDAPTAPTAIGRQTGRQYFAIPNGTLANPHGGKRSQEVFDHSAALFGTGLFLDNTVSASAGDANGRYYLSAGFLTQDGVVRTNSDYERTSIRLNAERAISSQLRVDGSANYVRVASNRIQQGSNLSGILLGGWRQPPDFDMGDYLVDYYPAGLQSVPLVNRHRSYRNPLGAGNPIYDHPFWTIERNINATLVNRIQGRVGLSYDPLPWLNLTSRVGSDYYVDRRQIYFPPLSAAELTGFSGEQSISEFQLNADFIGRATRDLTRDLTGTFLLGLALNHREADQLVAQQRTFINPVDYRTLANAELQNITAGTSQTVIRTLGLFGEADFGFFDQLFVKLTGRLDNSSTFGPEAQSTFFYPSVSAAWQFSQLLPEVPALSFGKLRASWGVVGREPGAYTASTPFFAATVGDGYTGFNTLSAAAYGGGFRQAASLGNPGIVPERTREFEVGADLRFLQDQLSLSAVYYDNRTTDAIFGVQVASSTGHTSRQANAATLENRGIELSADMQWPRVGRFSWNTYASWWTNRNTVVDLAGVEEFSLGGFVGSTSSLVQGEPFGVIFGTRWRRAPAGCTVDTPRQNCEPLSASEQQAGFTVASGTGLVLDANGFPMEAASSGVLGDPNPSWRAAIGNTLRYGDLSLNVLFDFSIGNDVWSGTKGALYYFGTHGDLGRTTTVSAQEAQTLRNWLGCTLVQLATPGGCARLGTTGGNGTVRANPDGSYTFRGYVEDFGRGPVIVDEYWFRSGPGSGFTGPTEQFIEDGSFVRLREVTFSYTWRDQTVRRLGLAGIDFSLTGRNLLTFTNFSGIDPETNLTGPSNAQGLEYFNNPFTRSYQFSVRFNY